MVGAPAQRVPSYSHLIYLWVFPLWLWGQTIIAQQPPLKGYFQPTSLAPRNSSTEKQPLVCRFPFACNCIIYSVYHVSLLAYIMHSKSVFPLHCFAKVWQTAVPLGNVMVGLLVNLHAGQPLGGVVGGMVHGGAWWCCWRHGAPRRQHRGRPVSMVRENTC